MLWLSVAVVSVVVLHCSSWERSNPPLQIEISEAHRIQKFRGIQGIASEILWRLCQDCPMSKDRSLIMNLRRAAAVHDSTAKQLLKVAFCIGCRAWRHMTSLHCPYIVLTMFESLESLERFVRRVLCGESARRLKGVAPGVGTVAARDLSRMNWKISEWISRHWRCRKYMNVSALEREREVFNFIQPNLWQLLHVMHFEVNLPWAHCRKLSASKIFQRFSLLVQAKHACIWRERFLNSEGPKNCRSMRCDGN